MRFGNILAITILIGSSPAIGRTVAGIVVGPGGSIGTVWIIPDANAPKPGYAAGKLTSLTSAKSLLRPDWSKSLKGVRLYKFMRFPDPISDFTFSDRALLNNCSAQPARLIGTESEHKAEYYLVVLDCPTASNPKNQLAAAIKLVNQKTVSIVINSATVPVVESNG